MDTIGFIGLMIVAITQIIKMYVPAVKDGVTILVAFAVAVLIALIDVVIGLEDVTVAEAIWGGFTAIGLSVLANKAGGGEHGDAR